MLQELSAIFPLLRQSINFSRIHFFHLLLLNGMTQTSALETLKSVSVNKEKILNFIRPFPNSDCHNPNGIKLITRLRLGLTHLREHKFKRSFQEKINPSRNCDQDVKSSTHFFQRCPFFINKRRTLLSTIRNLDSILLDFTNYDLTKTLLFGNTTQTSRNNFKIINARMDRLFYTSLLPFHLFDLSVYLFQFQLFYNPTYFPVYCYPEIV